MTNHGSTISKETSQGLQHFQPDLSLSFAQHRTNSRTAIFTVNNSLPPNSTQQNDQSQNNTKETSQGLQHFQPDLSLSFAQHRTNSHTAIFTVNNSLPPNSTQQNDQSRTTNQQSSSKAYTNSTEKNDQ